MYADYGYEPDSNDLKDYATHLQETDTMSNHTTNPQDRINELEYHLGRMLMILETLDGHLGGDEEFLPGEQRKIKAASQALTKEVETT